MNIELFIQRAEALHKQLADLYQTASVLPWIPPDLLPQAFKELYSNSKMVQLAAEQLYQHNAELLQTRSLLEAERLHYYDLFEFAPDAYFVTNVEGIIQEANLAAVQLLNVSKQMLIGQSMLNFICIEERENFRLELNRILYSDSNKEILLCIQADRDKVFDASLTVTVVRNQSGKPTGLRWLLRHMTQNESNNLAAINHDEFLCQNRPIHTYSKGEDIPLNPLGIFYVRQGLVKLNTFCETGEEILLGLATPTMVFGSSMTSLAIYQATTLTDVELISIHLNELSLNSTLSHILCPKINQRLKQTESLLFLSGKRKLEDRLNYFLQFLKQEVGELVPDGYRLNIRLTHEDIASACGTTRVTITRLIGKLQQQGLISFDSKKHIIIRD
ncbi:transcriptional regulator [Nostoc sp. CENA543]|uniref:helix-turn-helix domain-containing protein n=1 Tax=Nostoc sp. CENA543 TaxID=1869241 RepID=UPI000CA3B312|nr:helix-turn-helix domain-containing protein [Nostoc sp. CENA543]AUT00231.1 transcriptional regulator [Nostoc sp. CENA543]